MACGTIAALALGLGGTAMSDVGASEEQGAMNQATQDEINRQKAFQKQGMGAFQQSLSQSTPQAMTGQQQQGNQQYLAATKAAALTPQSLPSNAAPAASQNAMMIGQQQKNAQQQGANAQLQGYGNIGLQQGLKDLAANRQLGLINNQAQQQANIFPYNLQGAANSQQGLTSGGSLLSSLGSLLGLGSAAGLFGAAAPATGATGWGSTLAQGANAFDGMSMLPVGGYTGL